MTGEHCHVHFFISRQWWLLYSTQSCRIQPDTHRESRYAFYPQPTPSTQQSCTTMHWDKKKHKKKTGSTNDLKPICRSKMANEVRTLTRSLVTIPDLVLMDEEASETLAVLCSRQETYRVAINRAFQGTTMQEQGDRR
jgi:hypothetical protein